MHHLSVIVACSCPVWPLITPLQTVLLQQVLRMGLWSVALVPVNITFFVYKSGFLFYFVFFSRLHCSSNWLLLLFVCLFFTVNMSQHKLFHCYFPIYILGERFFPPPSGLSYSSWFCIEHFSSPPNNHPVRLLTVVRRANSSEQHYVCLAIVLSAKDRSLIVSTKEELLQSYGQYPSFSLCFLWSLKVLKFIIILIFKAHLVILFLFKLQNRLYEILNVLFSSEF